MSDTYAEIKQSALDVLLHNAHGDHAGLPRVAGWGYPEPYTRDLMIASLGMLVSGNGVLIDSLRRVLAALATNQTPLGLMPGLAHDPRDLGSSDTTPLFLIGLALYREFTGEADFLTEAAVKALTWLQYQSPDGSGLIAQQPTSDWRDEQWVLGYGLFVNTLTYTALRLWQRDAEADRLRDLINQPIVRAGWKDAHVHEGLAIPDKPYYALWAYKVHSSERFDLIGNCWAILAGVATKEKANAIINWVEAECAAMRGRGELAVDLPPCLFPYIQPTDPDWHPRYAQFNLPGEYHNGGLWPFGIGLYIAALVAAGRVELARAKLVALIELLRPAQNSQLEFGFNEWLRAQDGAVRGQDWQTWSAALLLYAVAAVETGSTPGFDRLRSW
ncbi:MAG: amylo-alpha-1,6-glucosidase [Chloroflexi bacterium]|uniref:glycoside hydrolase 100 family protein n=1 Tax=Candidatus Flexifilum breve TaxID=3140694 RepID=UPI003134B556|nr:amylo-alpha-1,6-glucosidase [Chloroflexota bacterium]